MMKNYYATEFVLGHVVLIPARIGPRWSRGDCVTVWDVLPLTCPPGQYSLGNIVPPDIIH